MKTSTLTFGVLLIAACSNPKTVSVREQKIKEDLSKEFTEVELPSIKTQEFQISDRDFLNDKHKYFMDESKYAENQYISSNAQSLRDKYSSRASGYLDSAKANSDLYETYKGNRAFHKVITVRMNPDTTHYSVLYFDDKDNFIYKIHYK